MVGKRSCSEERSRESEGRVTAAELSASEQPTDYRCSPGQSSLSQYMLQNTGIFNVLFIRI